MPNDFYREITGLNKKASSLVYGTAFGDMLYGRECNKALDEAFESGITTFDTARNYAGAEISLGRWLKERGVEKDIVVLSKCAHPNEQGKRVNEKAIREDFAKSQEYLGIDCIDIYLLHRDDPAVPAGEVVEIMNALKREGKIKVFGGSNWTADRISAANEYAKEHNLTPFSVSSPNFSLARQIQDPWGGGCVTITGDENAAQREYYKKTQMPVFAYTSLGRGLFSGKFLSNEREKARTVLDGVALKAYDSDDNFERLARCEILAKKLGVTVGQIALKWIFTQGLNTFAIVTMPSKEHIELNKRALDIRLDEKMTKYLNLETDNYD